MSWSEVESMVKSCVLSKKGEMTLSDLRGEYFELVGQDIPYKSLGCESLEILLNKISGVCISRNSRGEPIVTAASQKAAHIANLVKKQKSASKTRKIKGRITYSPRKQIRTAIRSTSRINPLFNQSASKTRAVLTNKKLQRVNTTSKFLKVKDRTLSRCLTSTHVRYIPAGEEEYSDDSYGSSPVRKGTNCQIEANGLNPGSVYSTSISEGDRGHVRGDSGAHCGSDDSSQHASYSSNTSLASGLYRTVKFTGNTLICTVSETPPPPGPDSSAMYESVEEDSEISSGWSNGPMVLGYHLVGDDFLLNFAYECLHTDYEWEDSERLSCGMCISGQTIHDFHMQIQHEGLIQPRIVLMLGAVDILQNRSLRCIIDDMTDLVEEIVNSGVESLVLLTLPFLRNAGLANRKVLVFNEFLKTLADGLQVLILDVHPLFKSKINYQNQTYNNCMNIKCYEGFAREILCYPEGVVLWSHVGRSYLYNFLLQQLTDLIQILK